jgi:hypothetical protein
MHDLIALVGAVDEFMQYDPFGHGLQTTRPLTVE